MRQFSSVRNMFPFPKGIVIFITYTHISGSGARRGGRGGEEEKEEGGGGRERCDQGRQEEGGQEIRHSPRSTRKRVQDGARRIKMSAKSFGEQRTNPGGRDFSNSEERTAKK